MRATLVTVMAALLLAANARSAAAQHAGHQQKPAQPDHSQHQKPASELPPFIPPLTDEDRKAAFPHVDGHAVHDRVINTFVLFDQLEWQYAADGAALNVDMKGWVGGDSDRLWFRSEGDVEHGRLGEAETHVLYGRQISRWWDVVGGVRQDFRPGPQRTWAAVGIQGLAPYWFEVELTGYVGESGRTQLRAEVEYELLLTNRLVLQPLFTVDVFGKADPERGIGAGVSATDIGLRLRYEYRRELAPYVGLVWSKKWGRTGDFAQAAGEDAAGARLVAGMRIWF